tara:strand:+ start:1219 stop:2043 length:825 start_codon:yes stop_codon:yes gene_type:complete
MKYLLLNILFLSLSISGYGQTNLEEDGLKGKVKSVKETSHTIIDNFGRYKKERCWYITLREFNKNGRKINHYHYNTDGTGTLSFKSVYYYDIDGYLIEFNDIYGTDNLIHRKFIYKYDNNKKLIEENRYASNGSLIVKEIYEYDSNGNLIEYYYYDRKGNLYKKESYKYDYNGNRIENNKSYSDGSGSKETYKYNQKGNLIEKNEFSVFNKKYLYGYDRMGNIIEIKIIEKDNNKETTITYEYTYDSNGSWIKKLEFENHFTKKLIERTIEYYD